MEKNRKRRNAFKRNLIAVAVASCFAGDLAVANPTGPTVVAGQASFQQAGNLLSITNSPSTIINWRGFSIGASEITRFIQQSAASAVLNRVTGGDLSTILGALQSNGRVFLVNPTGIVIGSGARIDVAGFVASTLNLPDADFLAGRMRFIETPNAGSIVNQGAINAASGGNVYLVAPEITNSGIITSSKGEVILAAGKSVELVNPGTPNLRVEIAAPDNQAINLGQIVADSGRAGIYAGIISNRGVIRADTIATGENGEILLRATKNITLEPGSVISASGAPGGVHDGGTVRIVADDTLDMQRGSAVHVDGGVDGGNGGFLELSGRQKIALNGEFTGRAQKAGYKHGSLLLDPLNINIAADLSLIATITAASGGGAMPLVLSPDGSRAYVGASPGTNVVTVIDTATNTVITTIPVAGAAAIAIKPDGSRVYAVNQTTSGAGTLSVIDTSTNTVIATPATGVGSNHISVRPDGSKAYITNGNDNKLTVLDTAANTTVQVTIQGGPSTSAVTPDGAFVYANNGSSSTVSVVDAATNTVVATIGVGANPQWIVIRPDGARAYTANLDGNSVSVINTVTKTVSATINVGTNPSYIAVSPDGSRLYVINRGSNSVSVINTATNGVVATVSVGTFPAVAAISPDASRVYVTNRLSDNISVISTATNTVTNTISVGDDPIFAVLRSTGDRVYVTNRASPSVSVLSVATDSTTGGVVLASDSPGATLNIAPSALNGAWSTVDLAATNNINVNAAIANSDVNGGVGGGLLKLSAGNNVLISAPIGTFGTRFDHDLSLNAGNDVIVNSDIYLGNRTLTLAADANIPSIPVTSNGVGNVIITPTTAPVTVDTQGSIKVSGVNFNVLGGNNKAVTVTAGGDLIVGNHPDLGGGLPELTGTMLVRGGTAGNGGDASATVHANGNVFIKAGSVEIRGGTATATAIENSFNTATANAELSAGNNLKLKTTSGGLTVAGGNATANAIASAAANNSATANANATLAATNSMTLEVAGGVTVQGGDSAQASAYYTGPNTATANANASVTAGTTLTLSATSLEVRGGDSARASANFGGPNTATVNANATLSSGGDMILTVGTGGVRVRGGDNAFASASSGTMGLNTARIDANALVSSGGLLTLTVTGGGLTVRGGDNAVASNSSGEGLTTALVNVKSSMLANAMELTVTDAVEIRGGNSAQALASCCNSSSAQNTATTTADALVRATNNLTLTINAGEGNSLTVAGGDNAKASGTEASGQSRNLTVNTNAELSAGGNLTVIMNDQGPVTVRGGDIARAKASASSSALSVISTVNARGKMAAGGLVEIKGPAGLVTVRGGDDARASANGSSIAITSATTNVEGQITGASVKITASALTVRGGNSASASATDNVGNTATITANGLLNATSALDLIISGAMNVAGGSAASATARYAGSGNTNQATTSVGALVTGGNITISAGSLMVAGGVQGSFDRAGFSGSGTNLATTLANANIVGTGNLIYTGGPVTLQGGTARTQSAGGSMNSATAQASAGIQVAGTKTLNVTGNLQILGGQALDTVVAPNTGSAIARAVLDPGALDATATGDVVISGGTATGTGSAYSAVIAGGPLTLRAAGAGKSITVNNSASVTSGGGGDVTLLADEMEILGPVLNSSGFVNILPFTPTRNIHLGPSGPGAGVLALSNTELNNLSGGGGGGVLIGSTSGASGDLVVTSPLTVSGNLALLAGNGMTIDRSITVQGGGSLVLNAGAGDLNIMPSVSPTRVESLDMALSGANVNVGGASGTQSTTVLANGLLIVGAASNFTVRGGTEAGAFTSVGGGGLTTIVTLGDVIVAGGAGSNASATVSGTPDVDMVVGGVVRLDAGAGAGASAAIMAGSATSIHLDLPNLGSGGFFVNGQEGVVHDPATATGFFAGGAPAVLGQSLLVTYGVSPPPSSLPGVVLQAINTTVQSTTEAGSTGEDSGTLRGERTASQGAGPDEEQKEKEKEEKARPVCN